MEYGLALIFLGAIVAVVLLRPLVTGATGEHREDARRAELEAAKEAKYREIRDAELDRRMGKLSEADYRSIDRDLREEAMVILRELDRLEGRAPRA